MPATAGLNVPKVALVMPGPVQVPPAGEKPVKLNAAVLMQVF